MPLRKYNGDSIPLTNELTPEDFDWKMMEWFYSSFSSPQYYCTERDDATKQDLADFLNKKLCGPFFIHESFVNTKEILELILLDPDDLVICRKFLLPKHWAEAPEAAQKNNKVIQEQILHGFHYKNPDMRDFLSAATATVMSGGMLSRGNAEGLMRNVWSRRPAAG